MPGDTWLASLRRPSTISIHYYRNMSRQAFPINRVEQSRFARSRFYDACEVRKHINRFDAFMFDSVPAKKTSPFLLQEEGMSIEHLEKDADKGGYS
jgi:hypothetical protein